MRWADPDFRARENQKRHIRYADPSFKEKERRRQDKRKADPAHREKEIERQKRRNADPEHQRKELERGRRRREAQEYRDRIREYGKKYYQANKAKVDAAIKAWYETNRESIRAKRNSAEARERFKKWNRDHLKKNPYLKVVRNVGVAIAETLKAGTVRGGFRFLPYSKLELRSHLERQFQQGMSWDNYGSEWHVDHILPQASFKNIDPSNPATCREFQACWSLANLRPLWKRENMSKNDARTHLL